MALHPIVPVSPNARVKVLADGGWFTSHGNALPACMRCAFFSPRFGDACEGRGGQLPICPSQNLNRPYPGHSRTTADEYDAYIVVSFVNATLILSIGETVEEVLDSGFLGTTPTLSASTIGDDALLQIFPGGIRHIRADRRINEWKAPGKHTVTHCAVNSRQVAVALSANELVYFELDAAGQLNEYTDRVNFEADVTCMAIGTVPEGRQRARFLVVGLADNTVRLLSLDPEDCLSRLAMQALPAVPSALCLVHMDDGSDSGDASTLYLNTGLTNGVMLRTMVDPVSGEFSDTRTRYLGKRPVKLFRVNVQGKQGVLALSSRSWLSYPYQGRLLTTPLSYETLDYATSFASEQCPEGAFCVAVRCWGLFFLGGGGGGHLSCSVANLQARR